MKAITANYSVFIPSKLGKDGLAMYQRKLLWLAQQRLTGETLSVFLFLLSRLDFDNYLRVKQEDISEKLKIHPVNVSKAIKTLRDKDIIFEGLKAELNNTYKLNPYIGHRGKNRKNTIIEFEKYLKKQGRASGEPDEIAYKPSTKKYLVYKDENGKVQQEYLLKPKGLGWWWVAIYQRAIESVARQRMTGEQISVFLFLLSQLDFENYLKTSLKDISENLNMDSAKVSKAMKLLKEKEIIVEGKREGRYKTYRINPFVAFKGEKRRGCMIDFEELTEKVISIDFDAYFNEIVE